MMKVPLNASTFGDEEINAAIEVLRSSFVTMGKMCERFEEAFAEYLGVQNAIFVNSGSSANLLAFFALANSAAPRVDKRRQWAAGAEVIVPSVTWSTTIWPIVQAGGLPVLVDCDPLTLQMRPDAVRRAVTAKTVAICPVHVLGNSVAMDEILAVANNNDLWVIEDTCEALGTKYGGKYCGTMGDLGTYSFFFSHHMTTIEGGMLVTDNDEIAELGRCLRAHGWTRHLKNRKTVEARYPDIDPRFLFINTGFNLRPTEINAAFGLHQLKKLDGFNRKRVEISNHWTSAFADLIERGDFVPMQATAGVQPTWFGYPILCRHQKTRNDLQQHLEDAGIETRPIIAGNLIRQPAFQRIPHRISGELTGADQIADCGLFWGSHPVMTEDEIDYVVDVVHAFFKSER